MSIATEGLVVEAEVSGESALTDRELDVLELLGRGMQNKAIGRALHISESTVKGHVTRLMSKMGTSNRTETALRAKDLLESRKGHR